MFAGAAQQREVIAHLLFQTKLALEIQRLNLSAINQIMGKIGYGPKSRTGWLYNQPAPYFLRLAAR